MKKGWTYKKIKDVGEVIGGTTPSTSNPEFWGGNICWISPAELHGEHYLYDSVKKITPKAIIAKSLKELPIGTVILSSRAPIGKIAINKVPMYCNQGFKCVVCGPELYNEYLYWWFYGKKDYLNSLGTGATFPEISKTVVENIVIPVAPMDEQRRIVSRLDAAFADIDALKANADKQLSEARQLFQAELTECIRPKEGWEKKTLGDIVKITHGKNQKEVQSPDGSYPIYGSGGTIMGYATDFLCEANTTILGRKGSINNPQFITERFWNVDTAFGISPRDNNNSKFIYYFITSIDWNKKNTGTTLPSLTQLVVSSVPISVPPVDVQSQIVSRLDSLSTRIKQLEEVQRKTMAECDALKQALLREVFE